MTIEELGLAIEQALEECPTSEVLSVITGSFVALVVEVTRRAGHDTNTNIVITDPNNERDITIHKPKVSDEPKD